MRRARGGSIIITSSVAGLRGSAGLAGYCATKGGVRLFAKAVAMEHATDDIRVNTVHPGVIDTPIWTKLPVSAGRNTPIDPHEVARAGVPLGRAGQAQDIANGVLFLRRVELYDGRGTRDRRGHDRRRASPLELRRYRPPGRLHAPCREIDSRVDQHIGQIADQFQQQSDQGEDVECGEHDRVVAVDRRLEPQEAETVEREDHLDQQ
jgi:hypothetical protein